jgi:hypothetical protein
MITIARTSALRAGIGEADITPEIGIQMAGDVDRQRPVEEIRAPLLVQALVAEMDGKKLCFVSMDALGTTRKYGDRLRREVAELIGTTPDAVVAHGKQSHSVPMVGHHALNDECELVPPELDWIRGGDMRYIEPFFAGVRQAVQQADAALRPVRIEAGRAMEGRIAFNRRFVMRSGGVKTHPPLCSPDILYAEGPVDPEVGVALLIDEADEPIAALLHFTCHPVHGYPQRWVSPDWPGAWVEGVRKLLGDRAIPIVINGACGNVHHINHLNPRNHETDTIEMMGDILTETTAGVLERLEPVASDTLGWMSQIVRLPRRELPAAELQAARELIAARPRPVPDEQGAVGWEWVFAAARLDVEAERVRQPLYPLEIQVLRLGDLAIVCWPGEPFVEAQLEVKAGSPFPYTFVAHWCNDAVSYIPTRRAHENGGFEVTLPWCRLAPGALETIAEESRQMLVSVGSR